MDTNNTQQPPIEEIENQNDNTEVALLEQDKSTVAILQEDDLKNLKEAMVKVSYFKRKYSLKKITVIDIENKDQKEKLRLALADMRTTRTALEKDKKDKTLPYRNTVTYINSNYDKAIDAISGIEAPAKQHKKDIDDAIEAKEKEVELLMQQKVNDRIKKLIDANASFDGNYYSIGSEKFNIPTISLGIVDIQTMTDVIFDNIIEQVINKNELINAATKKANEEKIIAEEKRISDELEEKRILKEQQDKLKKEQDDLVAEMEEFRKQKAELQAEKNRVAKEKETEEQSKQIKEQARTQNIIAARKNQLLDLGLVYNNYLQVYYYNNIDLVTEDKVSSLLPADEWNEVIRITSIEIEKIFKEAQEKASADKIIADKAIADKAIADKAAKDLADAEVAKVELEKKGDKAVWEDFISRLKAISYPEMKSNEYTGKVFSVKAFIESLK